LNIFVEETCDVFGLKLREQVEDRLKFYESGDIPRKNVDVMQEALAEAKTVLVTLHFLILLTFSLKYIRFLRLLRKRKRRRRRASLQQMK
jgi:hypothetical protein